MPVEGMLGGDLQRALNRVTVPTYVLDPTGVGVFGQIARIDEEPQPHPELVLTPRQAEVLRLLEKGRTTDEIAADLHLSRETVRNHVRRLLRSLGVRSRLEAVAKAHGDLDLVH